jgi:hypothetical protein
MAMISRKRLKAAMLAVKPQPKPQTGPPGPKLGGKAPATRGPFRPKMAAINGGRQGGGAGTGSQPVGGMAPAMNSQLKPPGGGADGGMQTSQANKNMQIAQGGRPGVNGMAPKPPMGQEPAPPEPSGNPYGGASMADAAFFEQQGSGHLPPSPRQSFRFNPPRQVSYDGRPLGPQAHPGMPTSDQYPGKGLYPGLPFGEQNFLAEQGDMPELEQSRPYQPLMPGGSPRDMPPADHFAQPSRGMLQAPPTVAEPEPSPGADWSNYQSTNAKPTNAVAGQPGGGIGGFIGRMFGPGNGPAKSEQLSPATTDAERMVGRNKYLYGQPGAPGLNRPGELPRGMRDLFSSSGIEPQQPEEGIAGGPPGSPEGADGSGEGGPMHDPNNPYAFQAGSGADLFQGGEEPPQAPKPPSAAAASAEPPSAAAASAEPPTSPVSAQRSPGGGMSPGTQRMMDKNQAEVARLQDLMFKNPQSQHLRQHLQGRIDALNAQNQLYGHIGRDNTDAGAAEMMGDVPDVRPAPTQPGQPQKAWWQSEEQFANQQAPPGPGKTEMTMKGAADFIGEMFGEKDANLYGQPGSTVPKINQPKGRTVTRERFKQRIKLPLPNEPEKAAASCCSSMAKSLKRRRMNKKKADAEDPLLARMMRKGKMDKGKAVAIAKSRGWIRQSGRHLELNESGRGPRNNAAKHIRQEGGSTKLSAAAQFVESLMAG